MNNFEYFSLKLDQRGFQTLIFIKNSFDQISPKSVPEPNSREKSVRINCGQNRNFEEHTSGQSAPKNLVKKSQQIVLHSDSDDEPKLANIKAKDSSSASWCSGWILNQCKDSCWYSSISLWVQVNCCRVMDLSILLQRICAKGRKIS